MRFCPSGPAVTIACLCLSSSMAWAAIGKIVLLEGTATRSPKSGKAMPLSQGTEIELEDTIDVQKGGNLKLELNDQSVIMLAGGSQLFIEKADFEGQERSGFAAKLGFGKVWTRVTKMLMGNDAKFQISTDRAVAGVRGTMFRIDAVALVKGSAPPKTIVRVKEGTVRVSKPDRGPRREVSGPTEVSAQQWEKKFVELQANQQVTVDQELGSVKTCDVSAMKDAFAKFIDANN